MLLVSLKSGLLALCALFLLNCRSGQSAYFQPTHTHFTVSEELPDSFLLPPSDTLPTTVTQPDIEAGLRHALASMPPGLATSARHLNPDAQPAKRRTWLQHPGLFPKSVESYTAERLPLVKPTKRSVPKGAIYALGGSVLPYGLLLISSVPTWALWLSLSLPIGALFLATGALTKIRRNKAQFKGKGWAIAAMLLATGYMGLVLYTLAALASSGVLWE